jgi:hypothetical protein
MLDFQERNRIFPYQAATFKRMRFVAHPLPRGINVRNRLTDRKIKALRRKGFRYDVMDTDVPGFGVRVGEAGLKTFILIARYPGSENPTPESPRRIPRPEPPESP